jgi:hypothetical protein
VDVDVRKTLAVLSRFILVGWACVWITALPLFHTHLPSMFQPPLGVPHTVFSPDLPGEYSVFNHRPAKTTPDESDLSVLASHSPELGFVASVEDGTRKPLSQSASISLVLFARPALPVSRWVQHLALDNLNAPWSPSSHGLRAPPAPVS